MRTESTIVNNLQSEASLWWRMVSSPVKKKERKFLTNSKLTLSYSELLFGESESEKYALRHSLQGFGGEPI